MDGLAEWAPDSHQVPTPVSAGASTRYAPGTRSPGRSPVAGPGLAASPLPVGRSTEQIKVGSVWRERRPQYAKRMVRVIEITFASVRIETLLTDEGRPPKHPVRRYVRRDRFYVAFEPITILP